MKVDHQLAPSDEDRHAAAVKRAAELRELSLRLSAGEQVDSADVDRAVLRAHEAHARARTAHLAAAERHRLAAEAHERAAQVHRRAAAEGIGDVATHLSAVAVHEAARDADYAGAEVALRMARKE
ncbi:hypothetical protein AU184_05555 [Mycolicibacterium novocastrense]|uniref:hypothetical protein n=1 Tax=Mycolicibacterium novocastrense TaxID=59813 RepID=UPI000746315F|nr:hypothetical protein [Mycolicibacterium novocastrense]KUH65749.1 hypothetical protein AU072_06890 [Mycolicibacterium novocastrense]KUH65832.1 hypothetical protein AU183_14435 [Mycolicibacterium novocastrense]KUH67038.1 hypothetical protein AU184_05555 [Mycolicibacterium novocastrense]